MTTGKPKTRLSEKLNAEMEQIRAEHTALMAAKLASFRLDITGMLKDVRTTISSDMERFLSETSSALQKNKRLAQTMLRRSPVMLLTGCLLTLMLITATSYGMARINRQMHLTAWGIQTVNHEGQTYLLLDPTWTSLQSCTLSGRVMPCIQIKGE